MVKYCDLAICDSVNIEKYIHECYDGKGIKGRNPKTTFIAYGADLTLSKLADDDEKLVNWYKEKGLTKKDYYLVVGRFVPENSFEVMIREFMKSGSKKDFALITNVNDKFLNELEEKLHFKSDKRIKFVGTVYDQELLKKIRENAESVKYFREENDGKLPSLKSLKKRKEKLTQEIAERKKAYAPLREESKRLEIASDNVYSIFRKTNEMKSDLAWKREWEAKVREKARQEQARQEQRERQPKRKKRSHDMNL